MKRHTKLGEAGFSFVELLVTIVIAGIAFAALVPVFVGANQRNAADTVRIQANQIAQDRLEKVRLLAYDAITRPHLTSTTWSNQFGPTAQLSTGSGIRIIHLDYTVTPYPNAASGLQSEYKVVTIKAWWDAPPNPVKPVFLSTIVYRQYAGPVLQYLRTDPGISDDGIIGDNDLGTVLLSAHIDLTSGVTPSRLQFTILGPSPAQQLVRSTDANATYWYDGNGTFYWRWDASHASNGVYDFSAVAFSTDGFVGNVMHLYPRIAHSFPPAAPLGLGADPGDAKVSLHWTSSPDADVTGYELFRSTSASGPWDAAHYIGAVNAPTVVYTDTTNVVNDTTYYYAVRAVTADVRHSACVVSNAVTPRVIADTALSAPTSVVATALPGSSTIRLTWSASLPVSDVKYYEIWRAGSDGVWARLDTWDNFVSLDYADATAGWDTQWSYKICAVNLALNPSPFSAVVTARTQPMPHHNLRISVKAGNNACNVWVLNADTGHYYSSNGTDRGTTPPSGTGIAKNSSVTFSNLPDGSYTIYANSGAFNEGSNKTYGKQVNGADAALDNVEP